MLCVLGKSKAKLFFLLIVNIRRRWSTEVLPGRVGQEGLKHIHCLCSLTVLKMIKMMNPMKEEGDDDGDGDQTHSPPSSTLRSDDQDNGDDDGGDDSVDDDGSGDGDGGGDHNCDHYQGGG